MTRYIFAGTAVTSVMLVALPFLGSPATTFEGAISSPANSSRSVIIADTSAQSDDSIEALIASAEELREARAADAGDEGAEGSTSSSNESGSVSSDAGSSGSSAPVGSGSSARPPASSAPTPAAPAPAAPEPEPPAAPVCPSAIGGSTAGAPGRTSALGVAGTTSGDLQSFGERYNAIRVANCLPPVPMSNIRFDSCMEDRLFWMAEDPSTDPMSAWGHIGSVRSDGVPSVGCDGNLAGGSGNTGATVAQKWWDSSGHRASLYKPTVTGSTANVCILFSMTHGGVPNEPYSFARSAARWVSC